MTVKTYAVTIIVAALIITMSPSVNAEWRQFSVTSKMTDFRGVGLATSALVAPQDKASSDKKSTKAKKSDAVIARLIILCQENKTELYVETGVEAQHRKGELATAEVRYRIDDKRPVENRWRFSTERSALFANNDLALIRLLEKSNRFRFEVDLKKLGTRTIDFDTSGLAASLPAVAKACNWKV